MRNLLSALALLGVVVGCAPRPDSSERFLFDGENAVISPDGARIAYQLFRDGRYVQCVRDRATGAVTELETAGMSAQGAWTPDGGLVYVAGDLVDRTAYQVWHKPGLDRGYNLRLWKDGAKTDLTTGRVRDSMPSAGPDGTVYFVTTRGVFGPGLFHTCSHLARLRPGAKEPERYLTAPRPDNAACGQPVVSPDGRYVVYAQIATYSDSWTLMFARVSDPERAVAITPPAMNAYAPRWNPDGRTVCFTGYRTGDDGWSVYLTDVERGGFVRVCRGENPAFAPDGRTLVYDRDRRIYERDVTVRRPAEAVADPCAEPERVVWTAQGLPDVKLSRPLDGACALGAERTAFIRVRFRWGGDLKAPVEQFAAAVYGASDQAFQLYRDKKGLPSFGVRTAANQFAYVQAKEPMKEPGEYVLTGVRAGGAIYISVNGAWPNRQVLSRGMLPLADPVRFETGKGFGPGTEMVSAEIGTGWPKEVPPALSRQEVMR